MFAFVRCRFMKSKLFLKIFIAVCLCAIVAFAFTACKDKEIYAESSDFESYPDYWNDFNEEMYVPETLPSTPGETPDFSEDDDENTTSDTVDTDKDGTPDVDDTDDDNDGKPDTEDPDDDNDGIKDEDEEKEEKDYGNQGPLVPFKN